MLEKRSARERLIVALDCPTIPTALNLVEQLGDDVTFYKVGWRLFLQGGMSFVEDLRGKFKDVFLDLKMNDIEETIETAVATIGEEAMFITVMGTSATARAAARGRGDKKFPKILSVTFLSSLDEKDLEESVPGSRTLTADDLNDYVLRRAEQALSAGADGLIASGDSVRMLRQRFPEALIVTPGVRFAEAAHDDHKRAVTPREAILSGSNFLVVGRPIHASPEPKAAVKRILDEMDQALAEFA